MAADADASGQGPDPLSDTGPADSDANTLTDDQEPDEYVNPASDQIVEALLLLLLRSLPRSGLGNSDDSGMNSVSGDERSGAHGFDWLMTCPVT